MGDPEHPLRRCKSSKILWACAYCGSEFYNVQTTLAVGRCNPCKCIGPPLAKVRYHKFVRTSGQGGVNVRYGDSGVVQVAAGKALRARVRHTRKMLKQVGIDVPESVMFESLAHTHTVPRSKTWVVQCFFPEARYIGEMPVDPTMFVPVKEVRLLMAGKKMMQIRVSDDLHKWLRAYVVRNKTTATHVILKHLQSLRAQDEARVKVVEL